jgi:predicted dehydrogenase
MVRIGIVGVGFMGMIHFYGAKRLRGAKVTAISTRSARKLAGDWSSIQGNFGPRGKKNEDLRGVARHAEIQSLLADPGVDLVDICLPTEQHADVAVAALRAGKHVLVEKSIALDVKDANRMLAEAKRAGRQLLVAHVLPFFPEFAFARTAIASGRYGRLVAAHFKRVISQPTWSADIASLEKTGGPGVDLHIHDTHFIGLVCGVPKRVYARGITERGFVTYLTTHYLYDDPSVCVTCSSGAICQQGRPFVHGYEIYLEKATLLYESGTQPLTVLTADGKSQQPKLGSGDPIVAFTAELQHAANVVRGVAEPAELSGQLARDALRLCHGEARSVLTGKAVAIG